MSDDAIFNTMIDAAKVALDARIEQFRTLFKEARGGPRLTKTQKILEFKEFLSLPPQMQNVVMGKMLARGGDPEIWFQDRQKLMEEA